MNSGYSTIKFEGNRYKCNNSLVLGASNVIIDGNDSVLFMDDDYNYSVGNNNLYFFSISSNIKSGLDLDAQQLENITIKNLIIEQLDTLEEVNNNYHCKIQMRVYNVDGLIMDGVELLIL